MRRLIAISTLFLVGVPLPAIAYTQADVNDCTPDARRLCLKEFPNRRLVVQCLVRNEAQLNAACTMAFTRVRAAIAARERPAGVQQTEFRPRD